MGRTHQARAPRRRTYLNGKLVYGEDWDRESTLDCTVRDLSEGGARVSIAECRPVPFDVYLIIVKYCIAHRARIVWTEFPARGLQFSRTFSVRAPLPGELGFLCRLLGRTESTNRSQ